MERSLRILDARARRRERPRPASVRRPRRSGLVLIEDASETASTATSSSRRPCCSRWPRWRPPGRPTSRRAGTASRPGRRAHRSPPASSRRARRTWRTGRRRSTSRCSRSGSTPTRATRPSSPPSTASASAPSSSRRSTRGWRPGRGRIPSAPLSPFAMPQYKLAATAAGRPPRGARPPRPPSASGAFIQRADNYSLAVVLFAASLFFAGISTRLHSPHAADGRPRARATPCSSAA